MIKYGLPIKKGIDLATFSPIQVILPDSMRLETQTSVYYRIIKGLNVGKCIWNKLGSYRRIEVTFTGFFKI